MSSFGTFPVIPLPSPQTGEAEITRFLSFPAPHPAHPSSINADDAAPLNLRADELLPAPSKPSFSTSSTDSSISSEAASLLGNYQDLSTWRNLKRLSSLSWPVILTFILELMPGFVNVIAVGHLGEIELASVSLAAMFCNVTGFTVGFGLATAMDTLCSQAYGSNNKKGLGVILQRALLILLLVSLPISVLWYFAEPLLLLMHQPPEVAALSAIYCRTMLPGLYPLFVYEVLKKFLQAQGIVVPQMVIALVANIWTVIGNWLFVHHLAFGYVGAPLARMMTNCLLVFMTFIYILFFKKYQGAWDGWSREALHQWGHFLALGFPGMLMICIEWWAFEVLAIFAGILGTTALAAQSIVSNVVLLTYFIPYGISVATSILIGNSLGHSWGFLASKLAKLALSLTVVVELFNALFLILLKDHIPLLFTENQEVIDLASTIIPIAAGYQIFDGFATVCGGILRGCGNQKVGAICNFIGYGLIGITCSGILGLMTDLGLVGVWLGEAISLLVVSIITGVVVWRLDWVKEVVLAKERIFLNLNFH